MKSETSFSKVEFSRTNEINDIFAIDIRKFAIS